MIVINDLELITNWLKGAGRQYRGLDVASALNFSKSESCVLGAMFQYFLSNPSHDFIQSKDIKARMNNIKFINNMCKSLDKLIGKKYVMRETKNIYKLNWTLIRALVYERMKEIKIQQSNINVFFKYLMLYQSGDLEKKNRMELYMGNDKFIEYVTKIFLICFNSKEKHTIYIVTNEFSSLEEFDDALKDLLLRASKRGMKINILFNVKEIDKMEVKRRIVWLSHLDNTEIRAYKSENYSRKYSRVLVISKSEGELKENGLYSGLTIDKIAPHMPRAGTFYQNVPGLFIGPQIYETWIKSETIEVNVRQE